MEKQDTMQFTEKELAALRSEYASTATEEQFNLWIEHCKRRNLVPVQDVILQVRTNKEWDAEVGAKVSKKRIIFITTIGGLRKIAERTNLYGGPQPTQWVYLDPSGLPTIRSEVPLPPLKSETTNLKFRQPWAAIAFIIRKGWNTPVEFVARFDAYAQTYKNNEGKVFLNSMWALRGPEQLEKCAKAGGYREAFPETQGLYIEEELGHDESEVTLITPDAKSAPAPVKPPAAVNQEPAQPTEAPRPTQEVHVPSNSIPQALPHSNIRHVTPPSAPVIETPRPAEPKPSPKPDRPIGATYKVVDPAPQPESEASPEFKQKLADLKTEMKQPEPEPEFRKPEAAPEPDRAPTLKEKQGYGTHLKTFKVDNAALKTWILKFTGAETIGKMTKGQYEKCIAKLDAVTELGQAAIDSLVKEVNPK